MRFSKTLHLAKANFSVFSIHKFNCKLTNNNNISQQSSHTKHTELSVI